MSESGSNAGIGRSAWRRIKYLRKRTHCIGPSTPELQSKVADCLQHDRAETVLDGLKHLEPNGAQGTADDAAWPFPAMVPAPTAKTLVWNLPTICAQLLVVLIVGPWLRSCAVAVGLHPR